MRTNKKVQYMEIAAKINKIATEMLNDLDQLKPDIPDHLLPKLARLREKVQRHRVITGDEQSWMRALRDLMVKKKHGWVKELN